MRRFLWIVGILCLGLCLQSCQPKTQKDFELKKVSYSALPDWGKEDFKSILPILKQNCLALKEKKEWHSFCEDLSSLSTDVNSKQVRNFLETHLTPFAVFSKDSQIGTFTGYYEATLHGSFTKDDKYKYPIYGIPDDLVLLDTKSLCNTGMDTDIRIGRIVNNRFIPYLQRKEITPEIMKAPILLWVDSPVDLFILHIQGSGRVETPDGIVHIGYAGNNGHDFIGIGSVMAQEGLLETGKSSMPEIKKWLEKNPQKAQELMNKNPRFIFFKFLNEAESPLGALGVPLTPKRSLAVDTDFISLGSLLYLDAKSPNGKSIRRIVLAQDKGSAIKGAIRGDFFWGYGEKAFENAGKMKSLGKYFLLLPKGFNL